MALQYGKRLLSLLAGLFVSAVGIVMMLQANIGLEPWSVLQQGMSARLGMSYGTATIIVGGAAIAAALILGEKIGIGSVLNILCCAAFIDALLWLDLVPLAESLSGGIVLLLLGLELLVIGTFLYMKSALGTGPRDALMVALARKSGRSVGFCRAVVELFVIAAGFLLGGTVGIGTVISALGLGTLFNINFGLLHFEAAKLHQETAAETLAAWLHRAG